MSFWRELGDEMQATDRGVDFITIDGGEGGTGAAPLVFADHVSLPFKTALSHVYREFVHRELHEKIVFLGSGKLGFPAAGLFAFGLGCDMVHVAREAMLSIGCIQAQKCHTGHCPAGIATQNRWLMRGLDPTLKSARAANYIVTLRKELLRLSRACGLHHPALVTLDRFDILDDRFGSASALDLFSYGRDWGLPSLEDRRELERIMQPAPNQQTDPQTAIAETTGQYARVASPGLNEQRPLLIGQRVIKAAGLEQGV